MYRFFFFFLFLLPGGAYAQSNFTATAESPHYLIVMPKAGWANMGDMVGGFAKYHAKNYPDKGLTVKQYRLTAEDKMPFVLVGTFADETDAVLYYQKLQAPLVSFLQMGVAEDYFIISAENYNEAVLQKHFRDYRRYFHEKYPQ